MITDRDPRGSLAVADGLARALRGDLPVTVRRLDVGGVSTAMLEAGRGRPLVLLHGQGAFAEAWGPVMPALAESFHVVAPDLPGLGRSVSREGVPTGPTVLAWLRSFVDATCDERPILVGASLGGAITAHFAIQHPERVRRIVLVDSGSLGPFRPPPGAMIALIRYMRRPSPAAFARFGRYALHDAPVLPPDPDDPRAAFVSYHVDRMKDPNVRAANRSLVKWSLKTIPLDRLRGITVPAALVWGRNDRLMRFRNAERVSRATGWPLYAIDDCGHVPMAERPAEFVEALRAATEADR
jgi:2-hydroxy-6-oxo-6-(2'-aminophenyl)hexa-2,4-dienoate hydrolase